jgi:predicted Zn-dependent protease
MTDHSDLIARLQDRAASYRLGGPSSEHTALLLDQAAIALSSQSLSLSEARAENDRKDLEIERLKKLSDRYGVALMMIRAGCSDPARFAGNILDDRQPVNVELDEEDFDENHR